MDSGVKLTIENPKIRANFLSKLFFTWMIELFKDGLARGLAITDVFKTLDEDRSEKVCKRLEKHWNAELKRSEKTSIKPNLIRALLKTFFWDFAFFGVLQFIEYVIIRSAQPIVLAYLIQLFAPDRKGEVYLQEKLYTSGALIVLLSIINIFLFHHTCLGQVQIGMRMRTAVSSLIYKKMLRLNKKSLSETPAGTIVNLLSNDVSRLDFFAFTLHFWWISFFQLFVVSYFIWDQVGVSSLAGIISMLLLTLPLQGFLGKLVTKIRDNTATCTDRRVKLMNEIITGIQVIKMYAWEKPFEKTVETLRLDEVKYLTVASYIRGFLLSCMVFIERAALYLTLLTYTYLGEVITADKVFSLSQFFNLLQLALAINLQSAFAFGAEALVACRRLTEFLLLDELEASKVQVAGDGVSVSGVTAKWNRDDDRVTLDSLNLEIPGGKLCVVIGPVGAGKSTLLNLLLGELTPSTGTVSVHGTTSYCSQEPWLFRATVRNNILFGMDYDKQLYAKVVKTCALLTDFQQFPNGDKTIVGERGVSLSGGQRARINLARAVYRNADVYLLDDPLSAVDTHVGKHLFDECAVEYLRGKTRILVTHQLQFLKKADLIVVMNKGRIEVIGSYDDLAKSDIDITKLMVAADESGADEQKVKRKISRKLSILSTNTVKSIENDATECAAIEDENEEEVGLKGKSAFKEYLLAAGNVYVVILVGIVIVLGQVFAGAADFWVTIWTDQEALKLGIETKTLFGDSNNNNNNDYYKYETETTNTTTTLSLATMDTNVSIYIYTGIIVGLVFLTIARSIAFFKMTMTASKNLHAQMFGALLRAKMRFFDTNPSGRILNRFSKDMGVVDELLPRAMMEAIQILLVMISILILIVITNYFMVITVVVLGSVFWVLRRWFLTTAKLLKHLEGSSKSPVYSHLNSSLNGITTIRVCRAEEVLTKEFDNHQDVNTSSWYLTLVCTASFGLWLDMITVLFTAIVVFSFIAMHEFGVSGSSVGLAISQSLILTGMLQYGIRQSSEVVNQMISVERILQYTTLDEEDNSLEGTEEDKEWPKEGKITFKHMNLRYAENELPVLSDMNVTINPGEKIGIVGRTGAGKSSLIASVFRLALIDGAIEIDGIDTKTICLSQLRKKISIIPQEPVLFSASMRFNLDPFGEFDDQRLWNVLKEVELKDAISSLDFEVDEGGANFSLGQRQLICLARAILRNNKILVLDEATANVDLKTDELIQATIRRKFTNCTVLTIAHRLNTIMESDKILVMDRGSVAEYEHPHLLLQRENGIFMSMVKQTGPQMTRKLQRIAEDAYNNRINRTRL